MKSFILALCLALGIGASDLLAVALVRRSTPINVGMTYATSRSGDLISADFNGDQRPDVATTHSDGRVVVVLADGNGGFSAPVVTQHEGFIGRVGATDTNGDGNVDLIYSGGGILGVLRGDGEGRFSAGAEVATTGPESGLELVDVNGDQRLDVILSSGNSWYGELAVHFADGNGGFGAAIKTQLPEPALTLLVGDVNGDGKPDAIVDTFGWATWLGNANGTFTPAWSSGYRGVGTLGNFNGDTVPDLALLRDNGTWEALILAGNGSGTFTETGSLPVPPFTISMTTADVTGDGISDVVTNGGAIGVLPGISGGSFAAPVLSLGSTGGRFVVRDFTADGKPDLVLTHGARTELTFLKGNGDGTFGGDRAYLPRVPMPMGATATGAVADVTGDGRPDTIVLLPRADGTSELAVLRNDGSGALVAAVTTLVGATASAMAAGDVNGDGRADAIVTCGGTGGAQAITFLGAAGGTFTRAATTTISSDAITPVLANIAGDASLDLLLGSEFYVGQGNGAFGAARAAGVTLDRVGDFDGNGTLDAAWFSSSQLHIALNNGDGVFTTTYSGADGRPSALGDFDGDGKLDVFAVHGKGLEVSLGNGDGTVGTAVRTFVQYPWADGSALVADFDGDGQLDVALSGNIFVGNGDGRFRDAAPIGFNASDVSDFDGNGTPDLAVVGSTVGVALTGLVAPPTSDSSLTFIDAPPAQIEYATESTFQVRPAGAGSTPVTGAVLFSIGGVPTALAMIPEGYAENTTASFVGALPVGTHHVTATYTGDATYRPSPSASVDQQVVRATTTLTASGSAPQQYGSTVSISLSLTAPVHPDLPGATGTLQVKENGAILAEVGLHTSFASITGLSIGTHTLTIEYAGDTNYKPSSKTVEQVIAKVSPSVHVSASPFGSSRVAGPVMLTASVSGTEVSGTVTFDVDGRVIGSAELASGVASVTTDMAAGTYTVRARYGGNAVNFPAEGVFYDLMVYAGGWGTPMTLTAAAVDAKTVEVRWTPISSASYYEVFRQTAASQPWQSIVTIQSSRIFVATPPNTTHRFAVVAVKSSVRSPMTTPDLATTVIFTDDSLLPGATRVKAAHILELRTAVNAVRAFAGLAPFPFTGTDLMRAPIALAHVAELRKALQEARGALGLTTTFSDANLVARKSVIRAIHMTELRDAVR